MRRRRCRPSGRSIPGDLEVWGVRRAGRTRGQQEVLGMTDKKGALPEASDMADRKPEEDQCWY